MANHEHDPLPISRDFLKALKIAHDTETTVAHPLTENKSLESNIPAIDQLLKKLHLDNHFYQQFIKPRIEARAQNTKAFNVAFSRFVTLIFYTHQIDNFLQLLDSVAAKGIAETGLRKNKDIAFYHDAPHPAEVAKKVGLLLTDYYNHEPESEAVMSMIFVKLAQAAAACHDIVQNRSTRDNPMLNEEESAKLCVKYIIHGIESQFQQDIGNVIDPMDSDIVMKVIDDFKKILPYIIDELIVPTTYLVKPNNIPLAYYIFQFEAAGERHGES